ncbi:sugar ABC transporter permease [Alloscardovia theropitheci]|uniref:Sugar ABC transporter permease n=1 Tax=Alloscardovia theropitheci TaxID=2496842 RepID=A0A4R0QRV0_9BIFI|nr:sugar ABC transporter permease [Alloscardovia theropitheci]TCD54098.1 sugar ABC transporter permease [Alloscardovia theropitheci]
MSMATTSQTSHASRNDAHNFAHKAKLSQPRRKVDRAYYWMTVPAAIIFAFFLYVPFIQGIMYSFTNSQGFGSFRWIGLSNYLALFQDERVWHAYGFTIFIAVIIAILVNLIAMFLAVLLNSRIAFKGGFRAIFFIPYTLAILIIGYVFRYIFMNPLPALGQALGIDWLSESMLTNAQLAWIPIVFVSVWQSVAYNTLLYLAGLQTIDQEVYEAAEIDGANAWQGFWRITFPLLGPFVTINAVLSLKGALGAFDQIVALTGGGPSEATETVSYLIYANGMTGGEYAYQTANAVVYFILLAIIGFIQLKFFSNREQI